MEYKNINKIYYKILYIILQSFLNEYSLDEVVGSPSEIMESGQNIDLPDIDIKSDDSLFMLNPDTEISKISNEKTHVPALGIEIEPKVEEESEDESNNSLERFIIVEEAVEEVTTSYDEHILEICQDDNMDTEQYDDIGYESLSSPEYDYRTHYSPQI